MLDGSVFTCVKLMGDGEGVELDRGQGGMGRSWIGDMEGWGAELDRSG